MWTHRRRLLSDPRRSARGVPDADQGRPLTRLLGSLLVGLAATFVMEYTSGFLYDRQSEESRQREEELRPDMPTTALVRKAARRANVELSDDQAEKAGTFAHYAFGAGGGFAAVALARRGVSPVRAGLAVATAMEAAVDQGANTLLVLTAPTWRFPLVTQVRAVAVHAVYGLAIGSMLEAGRASR